MIIQKYLERYDISYDTDFDTSKLSSIKVGGIANYVIYPKNTKELVNSLNIASFYSGKYKIIGGCTNVFFSDDLYDGIIISTKKLNKYSVISKDNIFAFAGTPLSRLIYKCAESGIEISSSLIGIPGTLGGALRNNAGAFGAEIANVFLCGTFYNTETSKIETLSSEDMNFSYRHSAIQTTPLVFLFGVLKVKEKNKYEVLKDIMHIQKIRSENHPNKPSLGSFFKKCGDISASKLIDDAGLKGFSVGGASISEKHAGFIINVGGATSTDINDLAEYVSSDVYKKYGIRLQREAEYVT